MTALRAAGHDVAWVRADAPGSRDEDVLARAIAQRRILLTFDKDFGELAWRSALPADCGIILFRLAMPPAAAVGATLASIVTARTDWAGHFSLRRRSAPHPHARRAAQGLTVERAPWILRRK